MERNSPERPRLFSNSFGISRVFTTHQDDDKEGDSGRQPCGATLAHVVVSVARAQNGDGRVRQRRRHKAAPMGDDSDGTDPVTMKCCSTALKRAPTNSSTLARVVAVQNLKSLSRPP